MSYTHKTESGMCQQSLKCNSVGAMYPQKTIHESSIPDNITRHKSPTHDNITEMYHSFLKHNQTGITNPWNMAKLVIYPWKAAIHNYVIPSESHVLSNPETVGVLRCWKTFRKPYVGEWKGEGKQGGRKGIGRLREGKGGRKGKEVGGLR